MAEKLGAILVRKGLITQAQLDEALKAQLIYGGRLGTNLVELDILDIDTLAMVLGEQSRYPVAQDADFDTVTEATLALLPAALAEKHLAFPLGQEGRRLKVAMVNPMELRDTDALSFATGLRIVPYVAPELRMYHFLSKWYGLKRESRFIRLDPSRRPAQAAAAPAPAGAPPASVAPPAPVRPDPGSEGIFGGLAPGQYLSDDAEADSGESTEVRWAPSASGNAHPADHLAPPAPPVAMIDLSEDGGMRVATPVPPGPPVLAPLDVAVASAPPRLQSVDARGPGGARPGSPPRLTPTELPRVAMPPRLSPESEPVEELDVMEEPPRAAMPPRLAAEPEPTEELEVMEELPHGAMPPRLAAEPEPTEELDVLEEGEVVEDIPVVAGVSSGPPVLASSVGAGGAPPARPLTGAQGGEHAVATGMRASSPPRLTPAEPPVMVAPPRLGQAQEPQAAPPRLTPSPGNVPAELPVTPGGSQPPGMVVRQAGGPGAMPPQPRVPAAPGMPSTPIPMPPHAAGAARPMAPQGGAADAMPPGMVARPAAAPGLAGNAPVPPGGVGATGAQPPAAMGAPLVTGPQPQGPVPPGMVRPSSPPPANSQGPSRQQPMPPQGAEQRPPGATPPPTMGRPMPPPGMAPQPPGMAPRAMPPTMAQGPVPPTHPAGPSMAAPPGARPPQAAGPMPPRPMGAPMPPPPGGAVAQGVRPPAMPGAPMPPGAARPQMPPPGAPMPPGAGGPPMPAQARPMAPGMMPGAPVPPGAPMGAHPGMPPRQGPPPGGPIPPGARGPGMPPPGMQGPGMPMAGPPMAGRPPQPGPVPGAPQPHGGMAPPAPPSGVAPQARVSGPPMGMPMPAHPGMPQVPPGLSPAAPRGPGQGPVAPASTQASALSSETREASAGVGLAASVSPGTPEVVVETARGAEGQASTPSRSANVEVGASPSSVPAPSAVSEQAPTVPVQSATAEQAPTMPVQSATAEQVPAVPAQGAVAEQALATESRREASGAVATMEAGSTGVTLEEREVAERTSEPPVTLTAEPASEVRTPAPEVLAVSEAGNEPGTRELTGQGDVAATATAPVEAPVRGEPGADAAAPAELELFSAEERQDLLSTDASVHAAELGAGAEVHAASSETTPSSASADARGGEAPEAVSPESAEAGKQHAAEQATSEQRDAAPASELPSMPPVEATTAYGVALSADALADEPEEQSETTTAYGIALPADALAGEDVPRAAVSSDDASRTHVESSASTGLAVPAAGSVSEAERLASAQAETNKSLLSGPDKDSLSSLPAAATPPSVDAHPGMNPRAALTGPEGAEEAVPASTSAVLSPVGAATEQAVIAGTDTESSPSSSSTEPLSAHEAEGVTTARADAAPEPVSVSTAQLSADASGHEATASLDEKPETVTAASSEHEATATHDEKPETATAPGAVIASFAQEATATTDGALESSAAPDLASASESESTSAPDTKADTANAATSVRASSEHKVATLTDADPGAGAARTAALASTAMAITDAKPESAEHATTLTEVPSSSTVIPFLSAAVAVAAASVPEEAPPAPEPSAPRAPIELDDLPAASSDTMELASTWEFVGWQGREGKDSIGHVPETTWADRAVDLDGPALSVVPKAPEPPATELPLASTWDFIPQPWQPATSVPSELVTSLLAAASGSTETPPTGPAVTAEQVLAALEAVGTQGTLGKVLLAYCAGRFRRAFLLGESFGLARVGHAWGPGSDSAAVSALKVDLEAPSMLTAAMAVTGPSVVVAPSCPQDEAIFSALGGDAASRLLVIALRSRGRPVAFVVADPGSEPVDPSLLDDFTRVIDKASEAYDRLPSFRGA